MLEKGASDVGLRQGSLTSNVARVAHVKQFAHKMKESTSEQVALKHQVSGERGRKKGECGDVMLFAAPCLLWYHDTETVMMPAHNSYR